MTGIAIEEMLHLAPIMNVMTAIGAAPTLSRPNFRRIAQYQGEEQPQPGAHEPHREDMAGESHPEAIGPWAGRRRTQPR